MATKIKKPNSLNELIELGKKKGQLTDKDVSKYLEDINYDEDQLDKLYDNIHNAGIEVVDTNNKLDEFMMEEDPEKMEKALKDEGIVELDVVRHYFKQMSKNPLLNRDEEIELAKRIKERNDDKAREKMISSNLRLVISVAKKYINRGLPFEDVIGYGNIGLVLATDKYDYRMGFKFSTFATWWIRQTITRALAETSKPIRLPVHIAESINRIKRAQSKLLVENEEEPTIEQIAEAVDMTPARVKEYLKIAMDPVSLEMPTGTEDDEGRLGDLIPDDTSPKPEDNVIHEQLSRDIDKVIDKALTPREARVMRLRYGLIDSRPRTLEEVAKEFNVTRERVRQIEAKALKKLRHPSHRKILEPYC